MLCNEEPKPPNHQPNAITRNQKVEPHKPGPVQSPRMRDRLSAFSAADCKPLFPNRVRPPCISLGIKCFRRPFQYAFPVPPECSCDISGLLVLSFVATKQASPPLSWQESRRRHRSSTPHRHHLPPHPHPHQHHPHPPQPSPPPPHSSNSAR